MERGLFQRKLFKDAEAYARWGYWSQRKINPGKNVLSVGWRTGAGRTHRNFQNHSLSFINICFCLLQSYRGNAWFYKTDPSCRLHVLQPFYQLREAPGAGEQSSEADRKCFCCPCQGGGETGSDSLRGRGGGKRCSGCRWWKYISVRLLKNKGREGPESEKLQMTTEHLKIMRWDIYGINNSKPCSTYLPRTEPA